MYLVAGVMSEEIARKAFFDCSHFWEHITFLKELLKDSEQNPLNLANIILNLKRSTQNCLGKVVVIDNLKLTQ